MTIEFKFKRKNTEEMTWYVKLFENIIKFKLIFGKRMLHLGLERK